MCSRGYRSNEAFILFFEVFQSGVKIEIISSSRNYLEKLEKKFLRGAFSCPLIYFSPMSQNQCFQENVK